MEEQSEMRLIPTALVNNLINYLQTQPYGAVYQIITALSKLPPSSTGGAAMKMPVKIEGKQVS